MSALLVILAVLSGMAVLACLVFGAWLWRSLVWEEIDDDDRLQDPITGRGKGRFSTWLRPKPPMLTYRRDKLGRFRRHRR